jgi:hypothetical protein
MWLYNESESGSGYNESFGERERGYTTKVKKEVIYNESDRDYTLKVKVQVIT